MIPILIIASALILLSCVTSPEGSPELMKKFNEDLKTPGDQRLKDISEGRPLFMDVQTYPQILPSGDLWLGGDMLLYVGREEMNFTELAERYRGERKPADSERETKP